MAPPRKTVEVTKTETQTIGLDMAMAAEWFCGLDDEAQADFFIEVARIAAGWPAHADQQWYLVGRHLKTCSCSTHQARELVKSIHDGLVT